VPTSGGARDAHQAALRRVGADHPEATRLIAELDGELDEIYPGGIIHGLHPNEALDPRLRFYLLELDGRVVGCGALRVLGPGVAELKRMFVRRPFRGRGAGSRLLAELETAARADSIATLRLETGPGNVAALGLYRARGYRDIPPYGEYIGDPRSICLEKELGSEARPGAVALSPEGN